MYGDSDNPTPSGTMETSTSTFMHLIITAAPRSLRSLRLNRDAFWGDCYISDMKTRVALLFMVAALGVSASAQWLNRPDPKPPRLPNGKPNLTAPAPRTRDGKIDLGGLWNNPDGRFLTDLAKRANITVPFTRGGKALFDERQANAGRDRPAGRCLPHSIPNAMLVPLYPWKIIQTPDVVAILYENFTQFRQIFTDGRQLPAEMQPTWFGYSVGRWDGDVLVVETAGVND